jgi:hypothetical protein
MNNKKLFSIVTVLALLSFTASSVLHAEKRDRKYMIEVYGGYSLLNPVDLNYRPQYDHTYEKFYTEDRYSYYHSQAGDFFTYTAQNEGEYKEIKHALPMGVRFKIRLDRIFWFSVGLKYVARTENSNVTHRYDIHSVDPDGMLFFDESTILRENSPYSLSVKGYLPTVGIHYTPSLNRLVNAEWYITAGIIFASCEFSRQRLYRETDNYGYWYESNRSYMIKGKGAELAFDAGARLNIKVNRSFYVFIDGSYAFQRVDNISGPGYEELHIQDANDDGYTTRTEWEGTWAVIKSDLINEWGNEEYLFPSNQYGTRNLREFKLDLSGFQFRLGIAFMF